MARLTLGWPLDALFKASAADIEASRVDCGTCPVSIQCLLADGGAGWRYDCCGSVGVDVASAEGTLTLILDCQKNAFRQRSNMEEAHTCPCCSGDLVRGHVLGMTMQQRYIPTVHAKVSVRARVAVWQKAMPAALAEKRRIKGGV